MILISQRYIVVGGTDSNCNKTCMNRMQTSLKNIYFTTDINTTACIV